MDISHWVQSKYIQCSILQDSCNSLKAGGAGFLVFDNFLHHDKAKQLHHYLNDVAEYTGQYALFSQQDRVSKREWLNAPEEDRFYYHLESEGCKENLNSHPAYLNHLMFLRFLNSESCMAYFSKLCGDSIEQLTTCNGKAFQQEHFLKKHADNYPGRKLSLVLYLNENWQDDNGGEFIFCPPGKPEVKLAPLFNRLIVFRPEKHSVHMVAPMNMSDLKPWRRFNYTVFFS